MNPYLAINSWVLCGFGGERSVFEAIDDVKRMGLDGLEPTIGDCVPLDANVAQCDEIKAHARQQNVGLRTVATGLPWNLPLSAPEPERRAQAIADMRAYLSIAARLGARKALVIPGVVNAGWDPDCPVVPYRTVWDNATDSIRQLLPTAEALDVTLCLENVWNKFLVGPMEMKAFIDQFASPHVGCYFDIANCRINGYPEHWIDILGPRIQAVHVKNWQGEDCGGGLHGFGEDITEGDVDLHAVIAALEAIGYDGPMTVEMIPFCRLPDMTLPDIDLAERCAVKLRALFGR